MVPKNTIKLEGKNAQAMLRLYEVLEEHDDVQNVYGNYDVDEADDGVSALDILEKKIFDLMICDVVMPRLSAFEVIERMKFRSLPTSRQLPA